VIDREKYECVSEACADEASVISFDYMIAEALASMTDKMSAVSLEFEYEDCQFNIEIVRKPTTEKGVK
jgi:hypothetical protein